LVIEKEAWKKKQKKEVYHLHRRYRKDLSTCAVVRVTSLPSSQIQRRQQFAVSRSHLPHRSRIQMDLWVSDDSQAVVVVVQRSVLVLFRL
jgi:hypothetical protein